MALQPERHSTRLLALRRLALASLLAGIAATARAQAPSCAWGSGVALPGVDIRGALIADDGAAGAVRVR
jgi:hypothetical protein